MKRLDFQIASVSTEEKVVLKNQRMQTAEHQLFYIVCYAAIFL